MKSLEVFREINRSFSGNAPIKEWKSQGKKVLGWLCIYVPEELIHAAGMLPVRIVADTQELSLDQANVYVAESTCSFIRNCLQLGLDKKFDFMDGIAVCTACQGCTRLSEM